MSPLYGEGEEAFYRLQEEIMRRYPDTTLFAWSSDPSPNGRDLTLEQSHAESKYLLAPSPEVFSHCGNILFTGSPAVIASEYQTISTMGLVSCQVLLPLC